MCIVSTITMIVHATVRAGPSRPLRRVRAHKQHLPAPTSNTRICNTSSCSIYLFVHDPKQQSHTAHRVQSTTPLSVESAYAIATKTPAPVLSPQQIVSCAPNPGALSCAHARVRTHIHTQHMHTHAHTHTRARAHTHITSHHIASHCIASHTQTTAAVRAGATAPRSLSPSTTP